MAFVINKTQYKSLFDPSNSIPGPGAYGPKEHTKQLSPAPFNASTYKQSCFQVKQTNLGPGSYSRTCISECFKAKSTYVTTFKSKAPRFAYQQKSKSRIATQPEQNERQKSLLQYKNPRPNSTSCHFRQKKLNQKKEYLLQLRKRNQQRKINSIVTEQKGKVRILLSNPHNTENVESFYVQDFINVKQHGPGEYQTNNSIGDKNKFVIDWAKNKQNRFRKSKSMINTNPGPGSYQLAKQAKNSLSKRLTSSFSFGGVRTFMDTIIYNTSSQMKAQILESKGLVKGSSPGPGDYSPEKPMKDTHYYGRQITSSSVERFGIEKEKATIPGPGYYKNAECKFKYSGMVKQMRQKIFGKQGTLVKEPKQQNFVSLEKQLNNMKLEDHSATEQLVPCTLKQRCQSKAGTISHQARFKELQKTKQPGPGQYYSLFDNKIPPQPNGIFKSGTQRQPYIINKQNTAGTFYEVGKQDIAIRTKNIRQNIQSLKKVAFEKPGFDSSVERFLPFQNANSQPQKKKSSSHQPSYERDQIDYESFKPYKQKTSYASVFRSTTTREPFVVKNNPGPGAYQQQDLLNKVSFNVQYHQLRRQKTVSPQKPGSK